MVFKVQGNLGNRSRLSPAEAIDLEEDAGSQTTEVNSAERCDKAAEGEVELYRNGQQGNVEKPESHHARHFELVSVRPGSPHRAGCGEMRGRT